MPSNVPSTAASPGTAAASPGTAPASPGTAAAAPAGPGPVLSYQDRTLLRHGRPHRIIAGAVHYFRIHPEHWQDRIDRLVALGVNTLDTYIAWNFHQPRAEEPASFTGWQDVAGFITLAGQAGLDVIVRPGPYICAEWDNGGFPAWVTADPDRVLRSSDPRFTDAVAGWFDTLLPVLAPLQASQGGPIVAVQIENEYGSYGDDQAYLRWNRAALTERGITELLFTADGGTDYFLDGGSLPDTWATATLGSGGDVANTVWERRRPGEPFFTVEFWNGWFDHWGEGHHTRNPAEVATEVAKILDVGGSICLYMAHGGSNFGLSSGANHDGALQPTVTSYDSDAPIAEDGALTAKFHALRELFFTATDRPLVPVPAALADPLPVLPPARVPMTAGTPLLAWARAGAAVPSIKPLSFEQLGLDRGLVLYSAQATLPRGEATLRVRGLHDRAYLWVDGRYVGVLTDVTAADGITLTGGGDVARLEILVENQGRINYGPLLGQGKGILEGVLMNQRLVFHWQQRALDLTRPLGELLAHGADAPPADAAPTGPGFYTGELTVATPADTHLALPGFGKGFVWLNDFLLGRYWEAGPQGTLYVPGPLLHAGTNTVTVLELERAGGHLELRTSAELGSAEVTHVEQLD